MRCWTLLLDYALRRVRASLQCCRKYVRSIINLPVYRS